MITREDLGKLIGECSVAFYEYQIAFDNRAPDEDKWREYANLKQRILDLVCPEIKDAKT